MGFWDQDVKNSLDGMFDMNRDGKLDPGEQALKFGFLSGKMNRDNDDDGEGED